MTNVTQLHAAPKNVRKIHVLEIAPGATQMTINDFIADYPAHPLTSLFEMLQDGETQQRDISTTKGMAAGMVVLLAHLNQLSRDQAIHLLEEIGPQASAPANNPAPGVMH